jgi:RNA polymerase sigma factor (sigma-70 family)
LELRGDALSIWSAVRALPERQRTCIVLRYVEDLSDAQIAEAIDAPIGTVKSLLSRARARLSQKLSMDLGGDDR